MFTISEEGCKDTLLQLKLSDEEDALLGSLANGFIVWTFNEKECNSVIHVRLPHGVRNISTKMTRSNSCMLSQNKDYIVAGVR